MKRTYGILILLCFAVGLSAQQQKHQADYLNHMDLGVSVSTTGIGVDIAMPVGDYVRVRTGFTYMPKFHIKSSFPVEFNGQDNSDRIRRMQDMMYSLTACRMNTSVNMVMQPTWGSFKFLVDVMPFRNNKHWNLTLGFYAGPSRIGKAYNSTEDAPTLVAVGIYNNLYLKSYMGQSLGQYEDHNGVIHDLPDFGSLSDQFTKYGMAGMPLGKFADGDQAMMVPDENSMAKAEMHINKFRPYVGVGYTTAISRDKKFKLSVDAGVLFWGGAPHVYVDNVYKTNFAQNGYDLVYWNQERFDAGDYTEATDCWEYTEAQRIDLTRDVSNVRGKVGDMVDIVKKFKL